MVSSTARRTKQSDPVSRIMAPSITGVTSGDSLQSVAQELAAGDIGAIIITSPGAPTGLISERDIVTVVATGGDVRVMQAAEIMTADLLTAPPQDSIESVGRLMLDAGVRHILIRDGDNLVGLVSMRDVLSVLLDEESAAR